MDLYTNPPIEDWPKLCKRPSLSAYEKEDIIAEIFNMVQLKGDEAVRAYTRKFDGVKLSNLIVDPLKIKELALQTSVELREAIDTAYQNIRAFHKMQQLAEVGETVETAPGVICWREARPIERVGLYIPGGSAPLISTVLMLGVPAQLAGCKEIIICTPPSKDLTVNPAICYAALKIGVDMLVCVGGAQAIAALAIGTDSVPKVDKIFGPGNQYVTSAKQYASRFGVSIDMPAGPSELMVVADKTATPSYVAADLLSQAEHGPDSQVILVTTSSSLAQAVQNEVTKQLNLLPRRQIASLALGNSYCAVFQAIDVAIEFANTYGPEHLSIQTTQPAQKAKQIQNAGSVFIGKYSAESAGDYASGTNHTLPTNGWAKSMGGISLDSFVKKISFQTISKKGIRSLAPTIVTLARAEGLSGHARSVTIRTNTVDATEP